MKHRLLSGTSPFVLTLRLFTGLSVMGAAGAQAQVVVADGSTVTTSVSLTGSGTLTVNPTGTLRTSAASVIQSGASTGVAVNNYGIIRSTGGRGFDTSGASTARTITINNYASALIQSDVNDALRINSNITSGSVTIINGGTILANAPTSPGSTVQGQAVDLRAMSSPGVTISITNQAGGIIRAMNDDALRPGLNASIDNSGLIESFGANTSGGDNGTSDAIDIGGQDGVHITNRNGGTISGARHGITADEGTYTYVTNEAGGSITGRNGSGVGLDGSGFVLNRGTITGAYAGAGNIFDSNGNASLNGDGDGVDIDNLATVDNAGIIRGTGAGGVDSGGRPNGSDGIAAGGGLILNRAGGSISGDRGILIDDGAGGSAVGSTVLHNAGTITGSGNAAITFVGTFNDTIVNSGVIIGNGVAIDMGAGNDTLIIRGGSITGSVTGGAGTDTLTFDLVGNSTVTPTPPTAVPVGYVSTITHVGGGSFTVSSAYTSFETISILSGTVTVAAGGSFDQTVNISGQSGLTVNSGVTLQTSGATINWNGATTGTGVAIDNSGTIRSTGGRAIDSSGGNSTLSSRVLSITNRAGGLIQSDINDAIRINSNITGGSVTIVNAGTILANAPTNPASATQGQAIDLRSMNTAGVTLSITNQATGIIRAMNDDALRPGLNASIDNFGLIESFGANTSGGDNGTSDAIDAGGRTGVVVTNRNGGTISGARHGITADTDITVTNEAGGTITGRNGSGVGSDGNGTVTNYGTITGAYAGAGNIFDSNGNASLNGDGDGVDIDQIGTVHNYGTIQGLGAGGVDSGGRPNGSDGIAMGGGTIENHAGALISGANRGILIDDGAFGSAYGAVTITNAGTIRGLAGTGIGIVGDFANSITNSGTISGAGTEAALFINGNGNNSIVNTGTISTSGTAQAVFLNGTGNNSLTTSGTIQAASAGGTAIQFGDGNNSLVVQGGSIVGNVVAGSGINTATFRLGTGSFTIGSAFTGFSTAVVESGKLVVNGSLQASGGLTVAAGAAIGGNGALPATTINGTIAPGNSIGTLTVNGNLVLAPGSTYAAEVAGNGRSDLIAVTGTATVTGSRVAIAALDPQTSYQQGQRYTILTATGGVIGSFAGISTSSAFLDVTLDPQTNNVGLTVAVKDGGSSGGGAVPAVFQTVAQTRNQFATAGGLGTLAQAGAPLALYNGLLMLDAASARSAFDLLSGEIHASAKTALVEESGALRAGAIDRLRSAFGTVGAAPMVTLNYGYSSDLAPAVKGPMPRLGAERFAVWGQGYGSWGRNDADGNAGKLTRSTGGLMIGADAAVFDTLRIGLLAGYSHSDFKASGRLSSGESDNYHLGLYGGGQWGALGLRLGASYTWHAISTRRSVAFAGFTDRLTSDYDAGTAQVFGELGYRIEAGRIALEPFAGLAYVNLRTDDVRELGGAAALSSRGDDTSVGYSTLGLRASSSFTLQGMDLTLRGALAWRHAFGDVDPAATLAFSGSNPFTVTGLPIARDAALVEAGMDIAIGRNTTLGISYSGQLAQDAQDHAFKANLAVKF